MEIRNGMVLLVIAATILVSGCSGPGGEADMDSLEGQWTIDTVADDEGRLVGPVEGTTPYVEFIGSEIAGNTGCNSFSGQAEISADGTFAVGDLATTLIGCDPARSNQEANIHRALADADRWAVEETTAVLSANGATVMQMSMADTSLAGSQWSVTSINNGHGGVQSVSEGSDPTLIFGSDGKLAGSTGCNNLIATYTEGDGSLSIGSVGTTKKLCGTPAGIMEQEQDMVTALTNTSAYSVTGDTLRMADEDGATQIVATRNPMPAP